MRSFPLAALLMVLLNGCNDSLSAKAPSQPAPESTDFFELTRESKGAMSVISLAYPQMICKQSVACEAMNLVIRDSLLRGYMEDTWEDGSNGTVDYLFEDESSHLYKREAEYLDSEGKLLDRWKGVNIGSHSNFLSGHWGYRCWYLSPEVVSIRGAVYTDSANTHTLFFPINFWWRDGQIEEVRLSDLFSDEDWKARFKPIAFEATIRAQRASGYVDAGPELVRINEDDLLDIPFTFSGYGLQFHHYGALVSHDGLLLEVRIPLHEIRELLAPKGPMARWL